MTMLLPTSFFLVLLTLLRFETSDTASVNGRVTYVDGHAISAAAVIIHHPATGETRRIQSGPDGHYGFTRMKAGRYSVLVEAEGYCRKLVVNVYLYRRHQSKLDLTLTAKSPRGKGCIEMSAPEQ